MSGSNNYFQFKIEKAFFALRTNHIVSIIFNPDNEKNSVVIFTRIGKEYVVECQSKRGANQLYKKLLTGECEKPYKVKNISLLFPNRGENSGQADSDSPAEPVSGSNEAGLVLDQEVREE